MGFLNILKTVIKNNVNRDQSTPIEKTTTPMGMHQGSLVTIPELDIVMAQADGSICEMPVGSMIVTAVGKYTVWDMNVYHCYFGSTGQFVQLVTKNNNQEVVQARYWHLRSEIQPTSVEDWEFWLGSWHKDENGDFIRNENQKVIKKEDGLIGYNQFQVHTNPPIIYNREWSAGNNNIDPVSFTETVVDAAGHKHYIKHEAMEYSRRLSNDENSRYESLLASVIKDDSSASVNIFIGIPLDHSAIKVLVS